MQNHQEGLFPKGSENNIDAQVLLLGAALGGYVGLAKTFSTGALQAFWDAQSRQLSSLSNFFKPLELKEVLPVAVPVTKHAAIGAAVLFGGYKLYSVFSNYQKVQTQNSKLSEEENEEENDQNLQLG